MLYKPVSYSIQLDFGLTTTNLNLGDGRLNLALRKWQKSECGWEKDVLVTSYDCTPSSNL